jgi:hypothetical protein
MSNDGTLDREAYNKDLAVSVDVKPEYWNNNTIVERLKYIIGANDNKKAIVSLLWGDVIVRFEVDTMPEKHIENFTKALK